MQSEDARNVTFSNGNYVHRSGHEKGVTSANS